MRGTRRRCRSCACRPSPSRTGRPAWRTGREKFRGVTQLPAPGRGCRRLRPEPGRGYGRVIGAEDAAVGVDMALPPTINIERDPLWGRAYESLGEDPFLRGRWRCPSSTASRANGWWPSSSISRSTTRRPGGGPAATTRSSPTGRSTRSTSRPSRPRSSRAHPGGVMCAYNLINGVPSCQDGPLLNGDPAQRLAFQRLRPLRLRLGLQPGRRHGRRRVPGEVQPALPPEAWPPPSSPGR